jgi:hypothetical protein
MDKAKLASYLEEKSEKHTTRAILAALVADGFVIVDNTDVRRVYLKGYDVFLKVQRSMIPPYQENLVEDLISKKVIGTDLEATFVPVIASTVDHRIIAMPYYDTVTPQEGREEAYKRFERHMASPAIDLYLTRPASTVVGTGAQMHYEYYRTLPACVAVLYQ